jgi:hypothetical protein
LHEADAEAISEFQFFYNLLLLGVLARMQSNAQLCVARQLHILYEGELFCAMLDCAALRNSSF